MADMNEFLRGQLAGLKEQGLYKAERVIQSAGRVIRTMTDRGVIALLGSRFSTPQYARLLPPDWYDRDIGDMVTTTPRSRLAHFWTALGHESPAET